MSGAAADLNLLVGIIALQMDFISRDALISAMHAWVLNKKIPLSQILQDQGALTEARRSLLDALVQEHIKLHDNDTQKSLAAVSSIGSVREELSRIADPDLQASLPHVSAARQDRENDPWRTVTHPSVGDSTSAGTRFRILRPHAKGGLGEVFVALDTELNRDVALKEIQDHYADNPGHRARFEFEAEVTGGLEHPGIVPVYGFGHTPDGRPFYAMRFIKGDSLKEAIRRFHEAERQSRRDPGQSTMALRELLGRFIDVCDAVAYAHSWRVLHRDLKPGNIMLGKYGETLVVDWGLAKALDQVEPESAIGRSELPLKPASGSAVEPTGVGSVMGTPGYMSPEQVDSRVGQLGVRSDVYCLGATLYHLLTGHAPCEAEQRGEIYEKVLRGDIPRPRLLNPQIAPPLEGVCLKSLALMPDDRYDSAQALKADLERWLADEPVLAWREPLLIRLRRWGQRHRIAVSVLAACLLTTIIFVWMNSLRMERQAQIVANYQVTAEALVDIIEVMAQAAETVEIVPPALSERGLATLTRAVRENEKPQRLLILRDRFRNIKSRLESRHQNRIAQRIDEIVKGYDSTVKKLTQTEGPGFGGGLSGAGVPGMIGD
jgi:serine/threonine-protein kinase